MKLAFHFRSMTARLRYGLVVAGWPGAVGLLLLLGGGLLQFALLPEQEAAAAAARADADREHQAFLRASAQVRRGAPEAGEFLAGFRDLLASEQAADGTLELIQRHAQTHGLVLSGTEYKWQRRPEAKLAEVRVSLSAKGGYGPLRAFVRDVLADLPGLAIEQFDVQRESVAAAEAEARLRFLIFLKAGS